MPSDYPNIVRRPDLYKARIAFARPSPQDRAWVGGPPLPRQPAPADAAADHVLYLNRHMLLAVSPRATLADDLASTLGRHADVLVTDASDALLTLELVGEGAADVLSRGCALDLRNDVFQIGHYASTTLGAVDVVLHRMTNGMRMHLRAPCEPYVRLWLDTVMALRQA